MRKVAIISNEESMQSLGPVANAVAYGLPEEINNISNLVAQIEKVGDFDAKVLYHTQMNQIKEIEPDCVVLSGMFSSKALSYEEMRNEYRDEIAWLRETKLPVLGICMGLQLICAAHDVGTKRLADENGEYGYQEIRMVKHHPILECLPQSVKCLTLHRCEVECVPEGFMLLASSRLCRNQMIIHREKPMIGTQFHPELCSGENQDGLLLLKRFLEYLTT